MAELGQDVEQVKFIVDPPVRFFVCLEASLLRLVPPRVFLAAAEHPQQRGLKGVEILHVEPRPVLQALQ